MAALAYPRAFAVLAVLLVPGCYADADAFVDRLAKLSCVRSRHCQRGAFDEMFATMSDCREDAEAEIGHELAGVLEICEYQPDAGRECIHRVYANRKECGDISDDIEDACSSVFVCPREGTVDDDEAAREAPDLERLAPLRSEG